MKPSSSNRQLPDLSLIRRELTASPELRLGWIQATPSPSREEGEDFFLDIPSYRTLCAPTAHAVVLYAPESNLERREIETLRTAKVSVDVAMYSFTDRELAAELVRLARSGVRVRVYRDSRESMQENQRRSSTTATLLAGGVEVRVKASQELMHFKSYVIDGALLRTGSANWSPTGLKRQDNDVHYEVDKTLAALFETRFEAMWDRATNRMATPPRSREGCRG